MDLTALRFEHKTNFELTLTDVKRNRLLFQGQFNAKTRVEILWLGAVKAEYIPFGDWWEISFNDKKRTFNDVYTANAYLKTLLYGVSKQELPDEYGQW
jgi:hypothetical protein